jgi:hypothetical protein
MLIFRNMMSSPPGADGRFAHPAPFVEKPVCVVHLGALLQIPFQGNPTKPSPALATIAPFFEQRIC